MQLGNDTLHLWEVREALSALAAGCTQAEAEERGGLLRVVYTYMRTPCHLLKRTCMSVEAVVERAKIVQALVADDGNEDAEEASRSTLLCRPPGLPHLYAACST